MKYKVIGWTYYEDADVDFYNRTITFAQRNAIIDDIRKNKYLFSGWHHQESFDDCVPILNDGKKRAFSQRGWGGVMAEAYGEMDDFSYAGYTFLESIDSKDLNFPYDDSDIDYSSYLENKIENETFEVEVSKELFEIAKTKNPFYLEDLEELRYIDELDTLILTCGDEKLKFLVDDIDRSKKKDNFSNHHLIKGKYKIIVTHKPFSDMHLKRSTMVISKDKVKEYLLKAVNEYDYNVLYNIFYSYDVEYVLKRFNKKKYIDSIKRFVTDCISDKFPFNKIIDLLKYIDDFEFFKKTAYDNIKNRPSIIQEFVRHYMDSNYDMKSHLFKAVSTLKKDNYTKLDLVLKAIELKPNVEKYRKIYYKLADDFNDAFPIMAGLSLYSNLYQKDKYLVNLNNYKDIPKFNTLRLLGYLSYPNNDVTYDKRYPYFPPKIYSTNSEIMISGVLKYQQYCKDNFDIENILEDILLYSIDKRCVDIDQYYKGHENTAAYIYALDALSGFKYDLKSKIINKYKEKEPYLIECINEQYE